MTAQKFRSNSTGYDDKLSMLGPDFPFAFDEYAAHPAGLGEVPPARHGDEVAIIGAGMSGIVAAYELLKLGLKPVVYEAVRIGGRLRSEPVQGVDGMVVELGGMRFPPTGKTFSVMGTDIYLIRDGRFRGRWGNEDALGMMTQLGYAGPDG